LDRIRGFGPRDRGSNPRALVVFTKSKCGPARLVGRLSARARFTIMANSHFWELVYRVIKEADVVLEVLDARLIDETRNEEIESIIKEFHKKLIHVVNKIDLADKETVEKQLKKLSNPVFVSSKQRLGTTILKRKILEVGRKDVITVGVVGYPNTGKSSVINAIAGSKKARTSPTSGFTRGVQKVKASERIILLDTPGVIPIEDQDIIRHCLIGSKNPQAVKEPDFIAVHLIKTLDGRIEKHYGVPRQDDAEATLESIAVKMNRLKKGGLPDIDGISRTIIMDWQRGNIK
jgi:ribosome biogenesis GTPase A